MSDLVSLTCPSLQIMGKTQTGISYFRISDQSLIKVNCHNFRTSDDTDMKLGPVTTLDKTTSKKIDVDAMSENDDVIAISSQFGAIRIPDSGHIVCNLFSLIVTFYLTKTENRTEKSLTQLSHYCFE